MLIHLGPTIFPVKTQQSSQMQRKPHSGCAAVGNPPLGSVFILGEVSLNGWVRENLKRPQRLRGQVGGVLSRRDVSVHAMS